MLEDSHSNEACVKILYEGLKKLDSKQMKGCYDVNATFEDPIFGKLTTNETFAMWDMLCSRAKDFSLTYSDITCDDEKGEGNLVASYTFSATNRPVVNQIHSQFTFKKGKILTQKDSFSLWKWTGHAIGFSGWLFGWLPNFRKKLQSNVKKGLHQFMK